MPGYNLIVTKMITSKKYKEDFIMEKVIEFLQANPIVKGQYETADNPIFEVFYLENPHGVIADFSGNPPYEF